MSYAIHDINGFIGDLATNSGLKALSDFIQEDGSDQIKELFEQGTIEASDELIDDLESLPEPDNADVADTLRNLIDLVKNCEDIVIISSGI